MSKTLKKDTHGHVQCYNAGCRCELCNAANTKRKFDADAKRRAKGLPLGDSRHGTYNGYTNWGCTCEKCFLVAKVTVKQQHAKRMPPPEGSDMHGQYSTYVSFKCRCPLCCKAQQDYTREYAVKLGVPDEGDPSHGTSYAYNVRRCRCAICRAGDTRRGRERREAKRMLE